MAEAKICTICNEKKPQRAETVNGQPLCGSCLLSMFKPEEHEAIKAWALNKSK